MIENIKTFATSFQFTSFLALAVYWIPLAICLVVYFFRAVGAYKIDLERCTKKHYTPTLTIGWIVARIIGSTLPVVNLFCLTFDCLASMFKWLENFLDIPFVRKQNTVDGEEQ